ncbi:19251_t:CDS:1, partial [Gigaspora margarita]
MVNLPFFDIDDDKSFMNAEMNNVKVSEYIYSTEFNNEEMVTNNDELGLEDDYKGNTEFTYLLDKTQFFDSWKAID